MIAASMPLPLLADSGSPAETGRPSSMNELKFEAFYRTTAPKLWSYLYRLSGDSAAADDLLQKAYFRFIRADAEFVSDEHMRRFLYRTATNLAFDHLREKKREYGAEQKPVAIAGAQANAELRHDMMRVFSELKPQERALLWLAHVEGSSHEEIAEALAVKAKSVKVLLFRARTKLADLLKKKGLAPEGTR